MSVTFEHHVERAEQGGRTLLSVVTKRSDRKMEFSVVIAELVGGVWKSAVPDYVILGQHGSGLVTDEEAAAAGSLPAGAAYEPPAALRLFVETLNPAIDRATRDDATPKDRRILVGRRLS